MEKLRGLILIIVLLFSGLMSGQNFTIRSKLAHGVVQNTDLFLFSSSAGALTKLSWQAMYQSFDDLSLTWTGAQTYSAAITFDGNASMRGLLSVTSTGRFQINNSLSPLYLGELTTTSARQYLRYNGLNSDTLATWRHLWADGFTVLGNWIFNNSVQVNGVGKALTLGTSTDFSQAGGGAFTSGAMATFTNDTLRTGEETNFYLQGSMSFENDSIFVNTTTYVIDLDPTDDRVSNFIEVIGSIGSAQKVINITGGKEGQELIIMGDPQGEDNDVTIQHNSNLQLINSVDLLLSPEESIKLIFHDGVWYQTGNSAIRRFVLPASSTIFNTLGGVGASGSGLVVYEYGTSLRDTILSKRATRTDDFLWGGDQTYSGANIKTPQTIGLAGGSQTIGLTREFIVIDGNATPSSISDFTGTKTNGTTITIICDPSDANGFTILDGVTIVCHGGSNVSMTAGDVVEFIYYNKWYQKAPYANNN